MSRHDQNLDQPRFARRRTCFGAIALLVIAIGAIVVYSSTQHDTPARAKQVDLAADVGINEKLNAQVPLDIRLRDESGKIVALRDLLNGKPLILTPVYYECPMLCNMTMDGQLRSLAEVSLNAGIDYTVLTVSFDPREDRELATRAKRTALKRYGRADADQGWRFLTGEDSEVRRLMQSVGFRYKFDPATGQYAHVAALIVLTPEGTVSRYLYGVEYPPRDLRLALVEASDGQVGSTTDRVLLLCYHYDPTTGKYGLAIMNLLRLGGLVTLAGMTTAIVVMIRNDRNQNQTSS